MNMRFKRCRSHSSASLYRKNHQSSSSSNNDMPGYHLCLKYVPKDVTAEMIEKLCSQYGKVISVRWPQKTPFKFVTFSNPDDRDKALAGLKNNQYGFVPEIGKSKPFDDEDDKLSTNESLLDIAIREESRSAKENYQNKNTVNHSHHKQNGAVPKTNKVYSTQKLQNEKEERNQTSASNQKDSKEVNKKETLSSQSVDSEHVNTATNATLNSANKHSNEEENIVFGNCVHCMKRGNKACGRCGDCYCSLECQRIDWRRHRYFCIAIPHLVPLTQEMIKNISYPTTSQYSSNITNVQVQENRGPYGHNYNHFQMPHQAMHNAYNNPHGMIPPSSNIGNAYQGPPLMQNVPMPIPKQMPSALEFTQPPRGLPNNYQNTPPVPRVNHGINQDSKIHRDQTLHRSRENTQNAMTSGGHQHTKPGNANTSNTATNEVKSTTITNEKDEKTTSGEGKTEILVKADVENKKPENSDATQSNKESVQSNESASKEKETSITNAASVASQEQIVGDEHSLISMSSDKIPLADFPESGTHVQITAVLKPNLVCVRSLNSKPDVEYVKIINNINNEGQKSQTLQKLPQKGDLIAAKFEELGYYRAFVLNPINESKIVVLFVDIGNIEEKRLCDMKKLSPEAITLKRYVFPVILKDISGQKLNSKNINIMEYLNSFIDDFSRDIKIVYEKIEDVKLPNNNEVELIDLSCNESINQHVCKLLE